MQAKGGAIGGVTQAPERRRCRRHASGDSAGSRRHPGGGRGRSSLARLGPRGPKVRGPPRASRCLRSSGWPQGPHGPLRTGPRDLWQVRAGLTPTLTRTRTSTLTRGVRALTGAPSPNISYGHAGVQLLEEDLAKVGGQQPVGLARGRGGVRVRVGLGFRVGVRVAAKARARASV